MTDEVLERIMARINNVSLILPIDEKNHRYGIMVPIRTLKQILYEERDEKNCSVFKLQEEKAEEYVNGIPFSNENFQIFHKDQIKQVYLDGLAEGRKDGYDDTRKENRRLEEENATLRSRIEDLLRPPLYDGYSLHKENEDLKKNLARYSEKIYEQEAQIEKMKRCNNCEFENYEKYHGENCNFGNYTTCVNWELKK